MNPLSIKLFLNVFHLKIKIIIGSIPTDKDLENILTSILIEQKNKHL
jgi:hypothetical protein